MQALANSRQPSWNPDQTFAPSGAVVGTHDERRPSNADQKPGLSIRQIRESMSINPERQPLPSSTPRVALPAPPKKKQSFLGGLFATKEPTQLALNQVAAQLVAQHGSTSPTRVPNVRMEKMPEHVPKVNSKWDGVPDNIKDRDKRERDKQRALKRMSVMSDSTKSRARSVESSDRRGRYLPSAGSSSRDFSIGSRPKSTNSRRSDPRCPNPHRFYAQSVNSSGDLASQQRNEDAPDASTVLSRPTRSPSTSSANVVIMKIPPSPIVPDVYRSETTKLVTESNSSSRGSKLSQFTPSEGRNSVVEALPDHTLSPTASPREGSPVTPSTQHAREHYASVRGSVISNSELVALESSGPHVLELPVTTSKKKLMKQRSEAFLAGEARPFELPEEDDNDKAETLGTSNDLRPRHWGGIRSSLLGRKAPELPSSSIDRVAQDLTARPDSSRSRLGLKPSMLVRTDATPWQGQQGASLSPRSANMRSRAEPLSPKRLLPSLGSMRRKES